MHNDDKRREIEFKITKALFGLFLVILPIYVFSLIINTFAGHSISYNEIAVIVALMIALLICLFAMVTYREYERDKKEKEKRLKDANISLSTAQAKIHWLANVIDAIASISSEYPLLYSKLTALSSYLRTNEAMRNTKIKCVPINDEIKNIKDYIELEKMMIPDFNVEYHILDDSIVVPLYTIQTLVDNSIKHGLKNKENDDRFVIVRAYRSGNVHKIEVFDNGLGFDIRTVYDETHTGIKNIRFRLKETLDADLKIESEVGFGTQVTITIPIISQQTRGGGN